MTWLWRILQFWAPTLTPKNLSHLAKMTMDYSGTLWPNKNIQRVGWPIGSLPLALTSQNHWKAASWRVQETTILGNAAGPKPEYFPKISDEQGSWQRLVMIPLELKECVVNRDFFHFCGCKWDSVEDHQTASVSCSNQKGARVGPYEYQLYFLNKWSYFSPISYIY